MASQSARCASMSITSSSTGSTTRRHARRDTKASAGQEPSTPEPTRAISSKCSTKDCQACSSLRLCTQSLRHVRRTVTIRPKEQYEALQARRQPRKHQGLQDPVCHPCRRGRDDFARGPHHGITPLALHRARAHASAPCGNSGCHQCRSSHPLVGWCPSCQDQTVPFCTATSPGCLGWVRRVRHRYRGCVRSKLLVGAIDWPGVCKDSIRNLLQIFSLARGCPTTRRGRTSLFRG